MLSVKRHITIPEAPSTRHKGRRRALQEGCPGHNDGLFALTQAERRHWLKVFALVFRREAFLPGAADARTFHQRAIEEGRFYEERVAANLSDLVFGQVFPELARAIAAAEPDAPLSEVREAALLLLYRLLFILYAEDRDLLPVRDRRYDDYALRDKVRGDVGRRKDQGDVFSEAAALSGAPASDSTSRTRSACRDSPCLANMCFTCERIVLSPRPVAAAISRTLMPSANSTATRLSIPVRPRAAAATAGSMRVSASRGRPLSPLRQRQA